MLKMTIFVNSPKELLAYYTLTLSDVPLERDTPDRILKLTP